MTRQGLGCMLAFCAFALVTSSAGRAHARACSSDSDCPKGFECDPDGVSSTDGAPTGTCWSKPCQTNDDCASGFTCYDRGTEQCLSNADGGTTCTPINTCIPQWDAPCLTSTDCGPGFTCGPAAGTTYECKVSPDASWPAYDTVTTVPCSDVPNPLSELHLDAAPAGFDFPSICDAGSYCEEVVQNACAPQSNNQPCSSDSDCASTWTCGCEFTCSDAIELPGSDASGSAPSCTLVCLAPNSDLVLQGCAGGAGGPSGNGVGASALPSGAGSSDAGGTTTAPTSGTSTSSGASSAHGGCQVGADDPSAIAGLVTAAALALARRRVRKRTGAPR
jgi:MYXO-CTERM domain-containing protein